jgi:hypothetical protein
MTRVFITLTLSLTLAIGAAAATAQRAQQPSNLPPLPDYIPATGTTHSAIIISGTKAGDEVTWKTPDGKIHTFTQYNDRGRGPRIDGTYALNDKGLPTSIDLTGNDYLKAKAEDHFAFDGTTASWHSTSEHGSAPGLSAFYTTNYSPQEELAMLVHAARANGGTLSLLPAGDVRVEKLRTEHATLAGSEIEITLYSVKGLSFTPVRVWLDPDDHFFATPGTWFAQVREGAEAVLPKLLTIDQDLDKARAATLAHTLVQTPAHDVLIHDVTLFDAITATMVPHQSVVISGNKIKSVGGAATITASAEAMTIEGQGLTLLPGLWDMHAHVSGDDGVLNLASGVTTVRDMGNDVDELLARRKRIEAGEEIGTRIVTAGFLDGPGPFQGPTKALVSTPADVRQWVAKYHDLGYPQIKIYSSIKPELVPVIVAEAHKRGMRVSGHIPAGLRAEEAIRDGYDEMQHMNFVFLNFMPDVKETRTPARFIEPAKRSADIDVKSPQVQQFIALMTAHHTVLDPTLVAFEGMITGRPGQVDPSFAAVADRFPPQVRRGLLGGGLPVEDDATDKLYRRSFENWKRMTKELYDHGITLDVGTDSLAGFAYHRELELLNEAGIPANKLLQIATITSARTMKRDTELGSIAAGKLADLVLVAGDPTLKIAAIRNVRTTIKDGKLYDAAALYREMGVKPVQ